LLEVPDCPRPSYENFRVNDQMMLPDLRAAIGRAISLRTA